MSAYAKLRRKRQLFVDAFVETGVLTEAARKAGYGGRRLDVAGAKIAAMPEVKAAILERQEEAIAKAGARRVKYIETLCYRAYTAGTEIRNADGKFVLLKEMTPDFLAAIDGMQFHSDGTIKSIKLATNSAMRMLGEVLGVFKQVHEVSGRDGGPIETKSTSEVSDLEVARRIAHLLAQGLRAQPNSGEKPDVSTST